MPSIGRLLLSCLLIVGLAAAAHAQKQGGTLRVTHRDNPPSASIHEEATISTVMPFASVFNNLVVFDPDSEQNRLDRIAPELATQWRWSEDGRTLNLTLREGVKWHDGKPFSSADVKCTWDMLTGRAEAKLRKSPRKTWYFNVREVTVNGPTEVAFHLTNPQPSLLALLSAGFSPVYPCHVNAAQMRTHPIGTGPFRFAELKQNESMRVVRNSDYWKAGRPYLDGMEFSIIPNRSTSILAFVAGKFDLTFAADLPVELVEDLKSQAPQAVCVTQPTNTQGNLLINHDKPPFNDPRVRKAVGLAIDRRAFSDILSKGVNKIGGAMMPAPEGQWGMSPEFLQTVPGYGADVEMSRAQGREIMKSLGYGPDKPLAIKVSTRNIAAYRDPSVILIDHMKSVFIQGELEPIDTSVWYARMARKDYAIGMNVQGVGVDDPDVVLFETYSCGSERNYTGYCNAELEKLFHRQSMMRDVAERRQLVWQIDKALQEDGARPVIYHGQAGTCWQPYVKGIRLAVNTIYNHWRFEDVWLDR